MEIRRVYTPYRRWLAGFLTEVIVFALYLAVLIAAAALIADWL